MSYQITTRPDGLTIITASMKQAETITISLMFRAGARFENPKRWGIAHFFEHMLFNGTKKYPDSKALSGDIDALGAIQNAYTWQEEISLWIKGAKTAQDKIFEIIAEEAIHPLFPEKNILKERKVILEELRMVKDDHPRWLDEEYSRWLLQDQKPVMDPLGREESIENFNHDDVLEHFQLFSPQNAVSVVAGGITHEQHQKLADKYFQFQNQGERKVNDVIDVHKLAPEKVLLISRQEMTQANLELGTSMNGIDDVNMPALRILNTILSGGMSTRLFQELREKNHLCYTVHAGGAYFSDFGIWTINGGMNTDNVEKAVTLMLDELRKLREEKVIMEELNKAKSNIRGKLAIASEDTQFISDSYARRYLATGQVKTIDDILNENEQITAENIIQAAQKYFAPDRLRLGVIGPYNEGMKNKLEKLMK